MKRIFMCILVLKCLNTCVKNYTGFNCVERWQYGYLFVRHFAAKLPANRIVQEGVRSLFNGGNHQVTSMHLMSLFDDQLN